MSAVIGNAKKEKPKVMIVGGTDSPGVVAALQQNPKINVIRTSDDWRLKVVEKEIRAAVEIPEGFEKNVSVRLFRLLVDNEITPFGEIAAYTGFDVHNASHCLSCQRR